jgi:hypothetical protein
MSAWLDDVKRRAVARNARARADAIDLARAWFDECAGA